MSTRGEHYLRSEELAEEAWQWPLESPERYALASLAFIHATLAGVSADVRAEAQAIITGIREADSWSCPGCGTVLHDSEAAGSHQRRHRAATEQEER